MEHLDKNWLTNELIDFEYKKYILLSYVQHINRQFSDTKLYPELPDINEHICELDTYKKLKTSMKSDFPKTVAGIDMDKLSLRYLDNVNDSEFLREIDEIVEFGLEILNEKFTLGKEILEQVTKNVQIDPIGLSPINKREGYLFLFSATDKAVDIYSYLISPVGILRSLDDKVKLNFLTRTKVTFIQTFEQIKKGLLRTYKEMPNPATFVVESKVQIPYKETLIPVVKRKLIKKLAA